MSVDLDAITILAERQLEVYSGAATLDRLSRDRDKEAALVTAMGAARTLLGWGEAPQPFRDVLDAPLPALRPGSSR